MGSWVFTCLKSAMKKGGGVSNLSTFRFPPSTDKLLGDWPVNRQGAPNCSMRFPVLNEVGHGDV